MSDHEILTEIFRNRVEDRPPKAGDVLHITKSTRVKPGTYTFDGLLWGRLSEMHTFVCPVCGQTFTIQVDPLVEE